MKLLLRFSLLCVSLLGTVACQNSPFKKAAVDDPYASNYSADGGYNPYDSGGGQPSYSTPPSDPLPPEPDPYSFNAPSSSSSSSSSAPKKTTTTTSKPKPKTTPKKSVSSSRRHTVKKGDTLYGIARQYKSTVVKIKSANGKKSDLIRPGEVLKIP
ncbi:MAG: LysM peptidoglycan-binding domain-containing protein [Verrucomicrobiaceae bacterium]|nr:LysM peptidoglycan-binding domain-containing protein [Verrucomicrobiaceae bacterium]